MKIATWNVNSIRQRIAHLLAFLDTQKPDIVLLQETKVENDKFPIMEIEERGYNLALHGQKTFNGVAILSKYPLEDIVTALPGDEADAQARYIEAVVSIRGSAVRIASVYVPNGQSPDSEKFPYKLRFLERLAAHAQHLLRYQEVLVVGGDYNVAPAAEDVYDPKGQEGTVCFHPEERKRFHALLHLGLYDAWRNLHPQDHAYSWWDYRGGGFVNDKGMRIDHLLLSPEALDCLGDCSMLREERATENPSDHIPVLATLTLPVL